VSSLLLAMSANDYEKNQFTVGGQLTPPSDHGIKGIVETKGNHVGEAADIYGDIETAEEFGYVKRG
jgi:amino acid transporter